MTELSTAKTRRTTNWSAIWVLPLIALLIGGWLAYRAYSEAGIEIEIFFPSGDGIQVNKTEVIYKGMSIGKVIAPSRLPKPVFEYLNPRTRISFYFDHSNIPSHT